PVCCDGEVDVAQHVVTAVADRQPVRRQERLAGGVVIGHQIASVDESALRLAGEPAIRRPTPSTASSMLTALRRRNRRALRACPSGSRDRPTAPRPYSTGRKLTTVGWV